MVARSIGGDRETMEEVETLSELSCETQDDFTSSDEWKGGKHVCSCLISVLNDPLLYVCLKDGVKYTGKYNLTHLTRPLMSAYCALQEHHIQLVIQIHFYRDTRLLQWFLMWAVVWLTGRRGT